MLFRSGVCHHHERHTHLLSVQESSVCGVFPWQFARRFHISFFHQRLIASLKFMFHDYGMHTIVTIVDRNLSMKFLTNNLIMN